MTMRTQTGLDQYDVESGSDVASCLPSHSRSSLWFGLIGAVLSLGAIIAWAEDPVLYIGSAFFFVVAAYCFFRLFVLRPSSKTSERTGPVVSIPAPSAPPSTIHLPSPSAIHAPPPPPYDAVCDNNVVNLEELLNDDDFAAFAIDYLHRLQKQLENGVPIRPEPALGVYGQDLQHLVDNVDAILSVFSRWGPNAGISAMLPATHFADLLLFSARHLAQDYTEKTWVQYHMASDIWAALYVGKRMQPENLQAIRHEAHQIEARATEAFVAAMWSHLRQMYELVCNGAEWTQVAESVQIWADQYDRFYLFWNVRLPDWETMDAYLSHVYAFISQ